MTAAAASGAGTRLCDNEQRPIWPALCGQARHWLVSREERGGQLIFSQNRESEEPKTPQPPPPSQPSNLQLCLPTRRRVAATIPAKPMIPSLRIVIVPFVPCESALSSHRTHPRPVIAVTKWRKSPHPVPPTTTQSRSILHNTRAIRQPQSLVTAQLALAVPG